MTPRPDGTGAGANAAASTITGAGTPIGVGTPVGTGIVAALSIAAGMGMGYGLALARVQLQSHLYPRYWRKHPDAPASSGGPHLRMNVIGDSAAAGVGAPHPRLGYVGLLEQRLAAVTGGSIHTENLAVPGASSWLLMERQLPTFDALPPADISLCVIGANDIVGPEFTPDGFAWTAERLYPRLPTGTVVATIPSFGIERINARVRPVNELITRLANAHDLELADLHTVTAGIGLRHYLARTGGDLFHPNAAGYRLWTDALWPAVLRALRRTHGPGA